MAVRLMDPDGPVPVYHQVAIATGTTQVHLAGQVAWDEHGQLVGPGDLTGQVVQVYRNVLPSDRAQVVRAERRRPEPLVPFAWEPRR